MAAAVMAFALFYVPDEAPEIPATPGPRLEGLGAGLDVSSNRPFAVFQTENPDVTVIWLLDHEVGS